MTVINLSKEGKTQITINNLWYAYGLASSTTVRILVLDCKEIESTDVLTINVKHISSEEVK